MGGVASPSQSAGRGRESLLDSGKGWEGWERSGVPFRGLGEVGRPSWRARRGWEALPEGWKGSGVLPEDLEYPHVGRENWEVHQ